MTDNIPEIQVDFDDWDVSSAAMAVGDERPATDEFAEIDSMVDSLREGESPRTPPLPAQPPPADADDFDDIESMVESLDQFANDDDDDEDDDDGPQRTPPARKPPVPTSAPPRPSQRGRALPTPVARRSARGRGRGVPAGGGWVARKVQPTHKPRVGILTNEHRASGSGGSSPALSPRSALAGAESPPPPSPSSASPTAPGEPPDEPPLAKSDDGGGGGLVRSSSRNLGSKLKGLGETLKRTSTRPKADPLPAVPALASMPSKGAAAGGNGAPQRASSVAREHSYSRSASHAASHSAKVVSPRVLSPRVDLDSARALEPLGAPQLDKTMMTAADRYRKMSSAVADLSRKLHAAKVKNAEYSELVGKVLAKAERQGLAPSPIASETASVVSRLAKVSSDAAGVVADGHSAGMGRTAATIDSVNASLKQQTGQRAAFDQRIAKLLKDREKGKKADDNLREVEAQLRHERQKHDDALSVCDSTMREVYERKEDVTAGFMATMLEQMLREARAQAALIPELERLLAASRGRAASGNERLRVCQVYNDADDTLVAASKSSAATDATRHSIASARSIMMRSLNSRVNSINKLAAAAGAAPTHDAESRGVLRRALVQNDMAVLNALCVAGRANEAVLLEHVCNALDAAGELLQAIERGVTRVVDESERAQTLFRSNTETTKIIGAFTKLHGRSYLRHVIVPLIEQLEAADVDYEVNPALGVSDDAASANRARLRELTTAYVKTLCASTAEIPPPLRAVARHLHAQVKRRFPDAARSSVGGYIFLRFVCPALMAPRAFHVVERDPPKRVARALTLVGKIVQNIANGIEFKKEAFMVPLNDLVRDKQAEIDAFLDRVVQVDEAAVNKWPRLATPEHALTVDLPALHHFMAHNVEKMVKTMADYKHFAAVPDLCAALADAGEPPATPPSL